MLVAVAFAVPANAQCKLHHGDVVVLYSRADDPDVLVWDSRFRLREYHAASFDEAQQLLPHAWLAHSGTRAAVESCVPNFVQASLLSPADDAVGIVISPVLTATCAGGCSAVTSGDPGTELLSVRRRSVKPNTRSRPSRKPYALHRNAVSAFRQIACKHGIRRVRAEQAAFARSKRCGRHMRPLR